MEGVEAPLITVPFESLKRTTRDRKYAIDEVEGLLTGLRRAASAHPVPREAVATQLDGITAQLHTLKRKLDDSSIAERDDAQRCRARLAHLRSLGAPPREGQVEWNRPRLGRLLVDYMLRCGYHGAAGTLAQTAGLQALTDGHVFAGARAVVEGLKQRRCTEALAWCERYQARLKKARSPLEFRLRVQEFLELVRGDRLSAAIKYARTDLAPWAAQYGPELQRAAAVLAFRAHTRCEPYTALFSDQRWEDLVALFLAELYRLHSLPPASLLEVHLQAGLSALKTPQSYSSSCGHEDPLHLPAFRTLAAGLPHAKHVHSKLVCSFTGQVMGEHNPPMVLPNGLVYSEAAVRQLSVDGALVCPCTGDRVEESQLRRAFVL